ncbi:MAG: putative metal-binding motif-containing protein [Candidatus Woesearchaeota archaeon]
MPNTHNNTAFYWIMGIIVIGLIASIATNIDNTEDKAGLAAGDIGICTDDDGDTYCTDTEPKDCDDTNPDINPGAKEECNNNKDDDCDGLTDTNDPDCEIILEDCVDNDGDEYNAISQTCTAGNDCDDTNPDINPGATEICNNNKDDNCNGLTDTKDPSCQIILEDCVDNDGDEYNAISQTCTAGNDCDDTNSDINPGATEICNNNKDDDCDGFTDTNDPNCKTSSGNGNSGGGGGSHSSGGSSSGGGTVYVYNNTPTQQPQTQQPSTIPQETYVPEPQPRYVVPGTTGDTQDSPDEEVKVKITFLQIVTSPAAIIAAIIIVMIILVILFLERRNAAAESRITNAKFTEASDYVNRMRLKGYDDTAIKEKFQASGWHQADINEIFKKI